MINRSKSSLIFSPNFNHAHRNQYANFFGVHYTDKLGKCLGTCVDPSRNKEQAYLQVTQVIDKGTTSCKAGLLSQASRLTLMRSVLQEAALTDL